MKKLISWVEIPATDLNRAVEFYNSVLQLEMTILDYGSEKMACFPGGEGSISFSPNLSPSKNGTLVSFNCENDIQAAINRVVEKGGEIVTEKTKIEVEGLGYFALFIDTEGNKVGLYGDS